jgi:hypothetical protein
MFSRKINTFSSILIIFILATFVAFISISLSDKIQVTTPDVATSVAPAQKPDETSIPSDTVHWKTYQNDEFYFGFRYPDDENGVTLDETVGLKRAYFHNDSHLLQASEKTNSPVKMRAEKLSFSIDLLTANDSDGKKITDVESFLEDYPYRRTHRIREERGHIGLIPTIEDIWPTKDSGLALSVAESRTIYAYYNDLIYQITIIPDSGIPAEMMSSFFFTEPKNVTSVGSPTTAKQTDYINHTLGFRMTFPQGWYFPAPNDSNPRIDNCLIARGHIYSFSCGAVRIADVTTEFPPGPKLIDSISKNYNGVESKNGIIPVATILKVGSHKIDDGPPEPDGIEYFIHFHRNSKVFKVFISDIKFEKSILSSIRLTN